MTEETKKKRDELAEDAAQFCTCTGIVCHGCQKSTKSIFIKGFDAGYQVAMDEANERIAKLREALEFYANGKNWECDETYNITKIIDDESIWHYSNVNGDYDHIGGKTARAALKEDDLNK